MKAVLSDRIYMEVLPHTQKKIDDELTYSIPSFKFNAVSYTHLRAHET